MIKIRDTNHVLHKTKITKRQIRTKKQNNENKNYLKTVKII